MAKKSHLLSIAAVAVLLSGCSITFIDRGNEQPEGDAASSPGAPPETAVPSGLVVGSGRVINEAREVSDFDRVVLRGSGRLLIEQTGTESLSVEAEDNILPLVTSEVSGRVLELGLRPGSRIRSARPIVYRLTMKDLHGIEVSGSGDVSASAVSTDRLAVRGSGSSDMTFDGRADRLEVEISGSGTYNGERLESREATVDISGSGDATVAVSDRLQAAVSGSGNVTYLGEPVVTRRISGSGSIRRG
ncbi:MAG: DUF2807 domain-containing protein [Actinomycetota bacterium]|nr:DUF2807 domain-containing protein [Actinomycetota bacterium]